MKTESDKRGNGTRAALLAAAAAQFEQHGFGGTDTNRIARAAGFAPQTFYRHFADKTAVFIHVYEAWQAEERRGVAAAMQAAQGSRAEALAVAAVLLAAHREAAGFRRSLRALALTDPRVRAARAASRRAQLDDLSRIWGPDAHARRVASLLTVERLCDAAADAETDDLAVGPDEWLQIVAEALVAMSGR